MIPYLMTSHEGGSDKSVDGRVLVFPSTRVNVYDPLAWAELKVIKSKDKLRHG